MTTSTTSSPNKTSAATTEFSVTAVEIIQPSPVQPPMDHDDPDFVGDPPPTPKLSFFKTTLLLALLASAVGGAFWIGWVPYQTHLEKIHAQTESLRTALPRVQIVKAIQAPPQAITILPGDVQASEETTVYARTTGYLKSWNVDIGDEVAAGQLLAEIDTPEVDQQLRQAQAELGQLQAKLRTAQAAARFAESTFDRYANLIKTQAITPQEYDERLQNRDTTAAAVLAAAADVASGEANVQRLTELQSFSKVYAPFAGTITQRSIQLGQLVTTGTNNAQPLFRIAKTDPVRVFIHVPQMYAPGVEVGLETELIVRERPNEKFIGTITRTSRAIDPATRTLLTEIQVPNPNDRLLTGSYVQVKLAINRQSPPIIVPASALIVNADGTHVATLDEDHIVHLQQVEIEGSIGSDVGLHSGLAPETIVISNPGDRLYEGQKVEIEMNKDKDGEAAHVQAAPVKSAADQTQAAQLPTR